MTVQQVVDAALRKARILGENQSATGDRLTDTVAELEDLLASWEQYGLQGWVLGSQAVTLVNATASYTFGTSGTGATFRPEAITDVYLIETDTMPLVELDRKTYFGIPDRTTAGAPTNYFYDPQLVGVLYLWPVLADVTGYTLSAHYRKRLASSLLSTDTLSIPPQWMRALKLQLALSRSVLYDKPA